MPCIQKMKRILSHTLRQKNKYPHIKQNTLASLNDEARVFIYNRNFEMNNNYIDIK